MDHSGFDPAERVMYAHDAHGSVMLMAVLFFLWGAVSLLTVPFRPFGPWNIVQAVVGLVATVYFVRTRPRPSTRNAVGVAAALIVYSLILLPWTAVAWCALGRPWEAFTVPQIGIVTMALVVPRFFWLGAAVIGLFAGECAFAYVYARHVGLEALVPVTEPWGSGVFTILGIGLLRLREQRRQMSRRHIRLHAEAKALRRLSPLFTSLRDKLGAQLCDLSAALQQLGAELGQDATLPPIRRAVDRLASVTRNLDALLEEEPAVDPVGSAASDAERQLLARDAHSSAILLTLLIVAGGPIVIRAAHVLGLARPSLLFVALNVVSFAVLLYLVATWRRPSEGRALAAALLVVAVSLPIVSYNQVQLFELQRPYTPFIGQKIIMVAIGLVSGRRLWVPMVLIVLTAADALVLYVVLGLGAHRDIISLAEPWVTLVFMVIGLALVVMREQRRAASIQLFRAESETSALQRRARLLLALRDQLNSPLQVLVLSADTIDRSHPREPWRPVLAGIERVVAVSERLVGVEALLPGPSSLDAPRELTRNA